MKMASEHTLAMGKLLDIRKFQRYFNPAELRQGCTTALSPLNRWYLRRRCPSVRALRALTSLSHPCPFPSWFLLLYVFLVLKYLTWHIKRWHGEWEQKIHINCCVTRKYHIDLSHTESVYEWARRWSRHVRVPRVSQIVVYHRWTENLHVEFRDFIQTWRSSQ